MVLRARGWACDDEDQEGGPRRRHRFVHQRFLRDPFPYILGVPAAHLSPMTALDALREEVLRLKEERRAIILSHNYQRDEVQDIADFVGDSLELWRTASEMDCNVIVFCGVSFMGEG